MKIRYIAAIVWAAACWNVIGGCARPEADKAAIAAVLERNARAAQQEDTDAYMATMHTGSPMYAATKSSMPPVFAALNLKYTVSNISVESIQGDEAIAHYTLLTEKADNAGPAFQNNQIKQRVVMKKEGADWKLFTMTMEKVDIVK